MTPSREQDELFDELIKYFSQNFDIGSSRWTYSTKSAHSICEQLLRLKRTRLSSPSVPVVNALNGLLEWATAAHASALKPNFNVIENLGRAIDFARKALDDERRQPPLTPSRSEVPATKAEKDLLDKNHGEGNWEITKKYLVPPSHHSGAVVDALRDLLRQVDEFCETEGEANFETKRAREALRHPSSTGAEE